MHRTFRVTVLAIVAGIGACWPSLRSFTDYWQRNEYLSASHGYVIAAISAWLIWRGRLVVEAIPIKPSWPFTFLTAGLCVAWYMSWISGLEIGYELLFLLVLVTAVAGAAGTGPARAVAFSVSYLCFAIPTWSYLNSPLQSLSARGVTVIARITGLPVYIAGNTVHIPEGSLEISGGCSGLNFFIAALAISALYGELNRCRLRHRMLLLAIAGAMAIVMNWVRIYGIILNAHMTDMRGYLVAVDHLTYGWVLFGVLLVVFFWIARRIVPAVETVAPPPPRESPGARSPLALIAVLAALGIAPALEAVAEMHTTGMPTAELKLPAGAERWVGPASGVTGWRPVYPNADAEVLGEYRLDDVSVSVYLNAYAYQEQGHELIGHVNSVLGDAEWHAESMHSAVARAGDVKMPYVEVTALTPYKERWVIAYVYSVGGRLFTRPLASKLYYGVSVLMGDPWSGVVAAAAPCGLDCERTRAAVNRFMADNGIRLAQVIPSRRAGT